MILSDFDYEICVIAETYRRRPPVEVKGWNHVVEVGYESPAGKIELMDPMSGEETCRTWRSTARVTTASGCTTASPNGRRSPRSTS